MQPTQPIDGVKLAAAIRRRLRIALRRLGELNRLPTDRELEHELDALQFRGARWGRRLQRIERDGLMRFGARELCRPARLLSEIIDEFEDDCLSRGILLEEIEVDDLEPMWVDAEQVVEALRCILEACIAQAESGAQLFLSVHDEGRYCGFSVRAEGVELSEIEALDVAMIHELLEGAGGNVRIEEIDYSRFLVTLRLPRESSKAGSDEGEGAWAA